MMGRSVGYWCVLALLLTGFIFVTTQAAYAGSAGFFYCFNGQAVGSLYQSNLFCPKTLSSDNVFSFLVCNMEQLSSNLMGNMFCGMIQGLAPAVQSVLVLATLFFGIGFTIGVIPATAREFQLFLIKVAFVWAFATQSEYLLDVAYTGLINGIRDGVAVTLTGYKPLVTGATQSNVYTQLDGFVGQIIRFATDYVGIDKNSDKAGAGCSNALFAVMAVMAIAFPPIFFMGIALLMRVGITFLRAIFGYIYALVGIAFLLTLAPFFLSFFLFKQTRPFFEKWVGYLASFALQIVILFAFLAFILSVNNSEYYQDTNGNGRYDGPETYYDANLNGQYDNGEYFEDENNNGTRDTSSEPYEDLNFNGKRDSGIGADITQLVMPVKQAKEGGSFRMPWDYCTICSFEVYDPTTGASIPQSQYSRFLRTGKLRCLKDTDSTSPTYNQRIPIKLDTSASPDKDKLNALIQFAGAGMMALLVMAYILESLLAYVGSLAQTLASGIGGASYAPQLGGGMSVGMRPTVGMPGDGLYARFEQGFDRGFATNKVTTDGKQIQRDGLSRSVEGMKEGLAQMIAGKTAKYEQRIKTDPLTGNVIEYQSVVDPDKPAPMVGIRGGGATDGFINWLVDPNHMDSGG